MRNSNKTLGKADFECMKRTHKAAAEADDGACTCRCHYESQLECKVFMDGRKFLSSHARRERRCIYFLIKNFSIYFRNSNRFRMKDDALAYRVKSFFVAMVSENFFSRRIKCDLKINLREYRISVGYRRKFC